MATHQDRIALSTAGHRDMHDLTAPVTDIVRGSDIDVGLVHVHNVGSTGAVGTVEFEPGLQQDLPAKLDELFPPDETYAHEQRWQDGNGHSHLQATTLSPSITVPVGNGEPILGTWQQIFHLECDVKPRERTVVVTVRGD
ncbi:MAG: secondary thiamine-phosphate synthase enzyme YjbQ [Salinibacter sp.]|jgi:conserved hypothetical protein TIGR00149|uniref:secondary thiamine-phosphate synthase enzyme YjbQ n=1 Tax=Salinibacter sp. TaxID=2065818 RepID=UPI002FC39A89